MKQVTLLALATLLALSGCKKDLDLLSGKFFGIKEFLHSKNCDAKCGETADCEGQVAGLEGLLDESNINEDQNQFYVLDSKDEDEKIEVRVDSAISAEVFQLIRSSGDLLLLQKPHPSSLDIAYGWNPEH